MTVPRAVLVQAAADALTDGEWTCTLGAPMPVTRDEIAHAVVDALVPLLAADTDNATEVCCNGSGYLPADDCDCTSLTSNNYADCPHYEVPCPGCSKCEPTRIRYYVRGSDENGFEVMQETTQCVWPRTMYARAATATAEAIRLNTADTSVTPIDDAARGRSVTEEETT